MKDSNLCSFKKTAEDNCGSNTELRLNLQDLYAMSYLSLYCANKYRAAIYLEQDKLNKARNAIGTAYCYWETYTNVIDELYISVDLQRTNDLKSLRQYDDDALKEYRFGRH